MERFTRLQAESSETDVVLKGLVELISELLSLAGGGVVTDLDGSSALITSATAPGIVLDRLTQLVSDGPCAAAIARGSILHIAAVDDHREPWPQFVAEARRSGLVSLAAFPLRHGLRTVGTLVLVSDRPRRWLEGEIAMVGCLAEMASVYLSQKSAVNHFQRLSGQLEQALTTRIVVEQAKGIISNANGIGVDAAYQLIRRHARSHNASVHTVAEAIVTLELRV
ncbi:GAF and ANTAR domain-containing protein [Prescottella agglutinans]|uniref:GAF domain-containing protein n=1 Tax=Prescottella agglutinans TaxID=1644129 RepID=A0ABT6MAN1_9NOCA|nr:GAF and ANTAR domain-containing protein [Prescottella agglutinans]MDH6281366.1 GAF domain-containing protein [Prescottella agglutinans]